MTKTDARNAASKCTLYLNRKGINLIIMIVRDGRGWTPEIPEDIGKIYPNIYDLATGS